ncbi:class I adenylate-forming enzyme family protein [Corynebacterium freneyi]|uniref:class I adenylate-forming enzyme family protein n=1 Tax=Corynebacterium freneyi TaxID=134034 RepID=UPI001EF1A64C|nr:class I adenylate-forming enzyme family protein [Corynebacterium freneyi]MCG7439939.1 acyl--CoA ligase [Corynebacterium freneyi]
MTLAATPSIEDEIRERHLFHLLVERFSLHADRVALDDGERELTYGELANEVDVIASELLRRGLAPGDRVAMLADPSNEFVISYLAATSIGCVWMGLNPKYTERELSFILEDADPALILVRGAAEEWSEAIAYPQFRSTAGRGEVLAGELEHRRQELAPGDPAMIIYTSGSTGAPKGAFVSAAALARIGAVQSKRWALEAPSFICNLPINHIGCVGDLVTVALYAGGRIRFMEHFDPAAMIDIIREERITGLFQIPTQLIRISELPGFDAHAVKSIELVGWGGAALPIRYIKKFRQLGIRMKTVYGSTETVASVTYSPETATDEQLANTVGLPDPDLDVRLLPQREDATGADAVPTGVEGEVCIRHWTTLPSYRGNEEATRAAYTSDGYLRTGDVGVIRPDGMLQLVGRTKDMFKSGGYNVYPREIELVMEGHPAVVATAVVPVSHPEYSEVGAAFIETDAGAEMNPEMEAELRATCRAGLANYKIPKTFHFIHEMPVLANGKIDKVALRGLAAELTRGVHHE